MQLVCGVYGEASTFVVEISRGAFARDLHEQVAAALSTDGRVFPVRLVVLRLALKNGAWLTEADPEKRKKLLGGPVDCKYEEINPTLKLARYFDANFKPHEGEIHVLVATRVARSPTRDEPSVKRARITEKKYVSLAELSALSEWEPLQELPSVDQLPGILGKLLPFQLKLDHAGAASEIFETTSERVKNSELKLKINLFLSKSDYKRRGNAAQAPWSQAYFALFDITRTMLRAREITATLQRNLIDAPDTLLPARRPNLFMYCGGLMVLRGEDMSLSGWETLPADDEEWSLSDSLDQLTTKMCCWNPLYYGDLPYVIGYAASGPNFQLVAIEKCGDSLGTTRLFEFNVHDNGTAAVKIAFNLAFLINEMVRLTKKPFVCPLTPFVSAVSTHGIVELMDDRLRRTIHLSETTERPRFERLIQVYTTLQQITPTPPNARTYLQNVKQLEVSPNESLFVQLAPVGCVRSPRVDEVETWLRHVLTALAHWHGCGYCHGNLSAEKILYEPMGQYWVVIGMDMSRVADTMEISWYHKYRGQVLRVQHDLAQIGGLLEQLTLPDHLVAVKDMLVGAMDRPELTAKVVLVALAEMTRTGE